MLNSAEKSLVFRILDLPIELRLNIFGQALTVGRIFYSPTYFEAHEGHRFHRYQEYEKPNVSISLRSSNHHILFSTD